MALIAFRTPPIVAERNHGRAFVVRCASMSFVGVERMREAVRVRMRRDGRRAWGGKVVEIHFIVMREAVRVRIRCDGRRAWRGKAVEIHRFVIREA